jgi:leucyl aminopeptidase
MKKRTTFTFFLLLLVLQLSCSFPYRLVIPSGYAPGDPSAVVPNLLSQASPARWVEWIRQLSGEDPVLIGGQATRIDTRYDYAMFTGQANARALDFLHEQVRAWVPESQVEVQEYPYTDAERTYTWKNLIVTLPGQVHPEETILLTAHFDSIVVREGDALVRAPGADDNGTGSAALLEAVRLLSHYRFERTIRIIWFSGEELGLRGSQAYTAAHSLDGVVGDINLDMFGYDASGDGCFEMHVGTLPASNTIGEALKAGFSAYAPELRYDYLTTDATDRSDHASFWQKQVGAVTIIENFFENNQAGGCQGTDINPYYHKPKDTVDKINAAFGSGIERAVIATVADLAGPLPVLLVPAK